MAGMAAPGAFPKEFEREISLRNGARVRIRPIRPDDEPRLVDLYGRLSQHSAYQRFFSVMKRLPPDWAHFLANVDYRRRFALVVEREAGADVEVIAVARYEPAGEPGVAEVAFVVQDGWQEMGLGSLLLNDLLRAGVGNGVERFRAYVLADNRRMLDLLARFTDIRERRIEQGVADILFVPRSPPAAPSRRAAEAPRPQRNSER